jgi:hypothetical protein
MLAAVVGEKEGLGETDASPKPPPRTVLLSQDVSRSATLEQRQAHGERAPLAFYAFDVDRAAV